MTQVESVAAEGLHWVKDELNGSLDRVRGFVEGYLDAPANPLPLQRSLIELHQIRGTLRMIQCDGAALLAEEMRGAVHDMLGDVDNAPEKAFETLLGATVQLTDYLDLLDTGERDNALVFLPLVNELRVARGAGVASESALFVRYAQLKEPVDAAPGPVEERARDGGQAVAEKHLSAFQAALLHVLKDQDVTANLERLAAIVGEMEAAVADARGRRLFAAAAAMIEALRDEGLTVELEIKRLLGRIGQQLKGVADGGDAALGELPDELLYGLVYFAGRSHSDGPLVRALRVEYGLDALLPEAAKLERLRSRLRGPNTGLVHKLSTAIKEDIATVKDSIDLVLRAGDKATVSLEDTVATTERVADTLAMLGLDMLKRVVLNQARAIEGLSQRGERGQDAWMDVALALLRVEQGLDSALFQHMYRGAEPDPEAASRPYQEINSGAAAIYREALVNISRIKTLIPDFIDGGEPALLAETGRLLREIEAGLQIIGQGEGRELLAGLRVFVHSQAMLAAREQPPLVLLLADAVASTEYYLEALQAGRQELGTLYQRARHCVDQLEVPSEQHAPPVDDAAQGEVSEPVESAPGTAEEVDPEIRNIFLEEAADVLATLQRDVPTWSANLEGTERLVEIRRAFHTLKGSGRMVGAADIGEFGWAVENMLNHCLEGALEPDAAVVVVSEAVDALPRLIDDFEAGRPPQAAGPVIEKANRTVGIDRAGEGRAAAQDSDLLRIFRADAGQHIEALAAFARDSSPPATVNDDVVRLLHTLKGSAEVVQMRAIADLAAALEHYADASRAASHRLDAETLALLADAAEVFRALVDEGSEAVAEDRLAALLQAVERCHNELPSEAVEASADRQLLVVFTDEACDLVDEIDKGLTDWIGTPEDAYHPRALSAACHTLKGSARTADAAAIGEVTQALESVISGYLASGESPGADAFERMRETVDGIYDMLDRFRHGDRSSDPAPLLERLGVEPVPPSDGNVAASAGEEHESGADGRAVAEPGSESAPDTAEGTEEAPDPELIATFLGEAAELMEGIDAGIERWTAAPDDEAPRVELVRLLHTLKGSARMAGITAVGDVSHELESAIGRVESADRDRREALVAALRDVADGIHRMLDRVHEGAPAPDPAPLLALLRGENAAPAALVTEEQVADTAEPATPELPAEPAPESAPRAGPEEAQDDFSQRLFWQPESVAESGRAVQETARVAVSALDNMLNEAGEISIFRARLEQQNTGLTAQLQEMAQTARRLREQLRKLDQETEAQIMARHDTVDDPYSQDFDPLEMDRYSALHELSRGMAESVTDLASLHESMSEVTEQSEALLLQHGRVNTSLQQGLMHTLMVPFSRQVQRLQRVVRQTAQEYERRAEAHFSGVEAELDRNVLDRMTAPLEHLLRNAVAHGIEAPEARRRQDKPEAGRIDVRLYREGTQLVIEVRDDGRGLDFDAIRKKAMERGLLEAEAIVDDDDLAQFIFEPGFSTAEILTQVAGRGVGMDVVNNEIKQLGGSMSVDSRPDQGTRFAIRLPLTLAISQALLIRVGDERYAVPLGSIEGVTRVPRGKLESAGDEAGFEYGGHFYRLRRLGTLLGVPESVEGDDAPANLPVLLVRVGERRTAFAVDSLSGSREIVVKSVGPQVATVPGVSGATIMADGKVVLILDVTALMQMQARLALRSAPRTKAVEIADDRPTAMVVDDSITIRRVSERFLSRHGFRVVTAKDGMDALAKLQATPPDVVLLDIEMPRIDGFELATYMRNNDALANTPIVMITSRSGDKHRRRAEQIGVDRFMTKPYQEQDLLAQIHAVLRREAPAQAG